MQAPSCLSIRMSFDKLFALAKTRYSDEHGSRSVIGVICLDTIRARLQQLEGRSQLAEYNGIKVGKSQNM